MSLWFRPALIGLISALLLQVMEGVWRLFPSTRVAWVMDFPIVWLGVFIVLFVARAKGWFSERNIPYQGISDFVLQVHQSPARDHGQKWGLRSIISFLLAAFTGKVGPEGFLVEANHEALVRTRPLAANWFEQQRRTDVACAFAGALAATFHAPLAAIVIGMELRIGGHTLAAVVSALVGFLVSRWMAEGLGGFGLWFPSDAFLPGSEIFREPQTFLKFGSVVLAAGVLSATYVGFVHLGRRIFNDLSQRGFWFPWAVAGLMILAVLMLFSPAQQTLVDFWPKLITGKVESTQSVYLLIAWGLVFGILHSSIGTAGMFLPLLVLGGLAVHGITGYPEPLWILMGGAIVLGAGMGIPLTAAILVFEWTRHPWILGLSVAGTLLARPLLHALRVKDLVEDDLVMRGLVLDKGRSRSVLEVLQVKTVMVEDGLVIAEDTSLKDVIQRIKEAPYPFVTIINRREEYVGIVAVGVVEEAAREDSNLKLLEAKDLLVRQKIKVRPLWLDDHLGATTGIFDRSPVIPVIDRKRRPVGLLFAHHVRIAYDREIERRSIENP